MPVLDIPFLKVSSKAPSVFSLVKMLPAVLRILPLSTLSAADYIARFKHPAIRLLLSSVVTPDYEALSLMVTLGCLASGDGGYIEGGSLTLAANMAKRFEELGGVIHYGKKALRIKIADGKACGAIINGEDVSADAVIISSDTLTAIDTLFDKPFRERWSLAMRTNTGRPGALLMCTFICIGIEADLSSLPESMIFPLETPIEYAGQRITSLSYKKYSDKMGYAPQSCSVITLILAGDTYNYWKNLREQGRYNEYKKELFERILMELEKQLPGIRGNVAVWDMATPLTYERFCGTYHGSWMTITHPGTVRVSYPCKSGHIDNLYFAGQRIIPPGGTPVAVSTGRTASQYLCRDFGAVFKS
jgi:phytoene dehydrogenase-like protein